jgi:hypothetical protein
MNNDTETPIMLTRERFRAMLAVNMAAEDLLHCMKKDGSALIPFYTERLAGKVAHAEALREAEWADACERSAASRERVARLLADRDLGVD